MTLNSFFNGLSQNILFGGVGALIILALMFRKANSVASSGNKAKMISWSVAPGLMVLFSIAVYGIAAGVAFPRIQGALTSAPVQNALSVGDGVTAAVDNLLFGGSETMNMVSVPAGADAFVAPVMEASAPVAPVAPIQEANNGAVISDPYSVQVKLVPINQMFTEAKVNLVAEQPANTPTGSYIVQSGDSIGKIARKLGVDANALCRANGLTNCNLIRAGQKLIVPAGGLPALQQPVYQQTTQKITAPRAVSNPTVYTQPKLNQSYLPPQWNVLEQGEMSVGAPANMSTSSTNELFASFSTTK